MISMIKKSTAAALAAILLLLSGCQATPEQGIVTNKNDGAFETALENSGDTVSKNAGMESAPAAEPAVYTDNFENTDGDVTFDLSLTEPVTAALPVLQVRPMEFTGQQVKKIAEAVFGNVPIYEYTSEMTRAEIEQAILDRRQFISDWDAMVEYYGGNEGLAQEVKADYEQRIAELEEAYQTASDGVEPTLCAWEFHPEDFYLPPGWLFNDNGGRYLQATAAVDGIPYVLSAVNREEADYRMHNFHIYVDDRLMSNEDLLARCGDIPDTDELRVRVLDIVRAMDIGDWDFVSDSESSVSGFMSDGGDTATFVLARVYEGIRTTYHNGGLVKSDEYASNYYYESLSFTFWGGILTSIEYLGPLDVVSVVNGDVQILPFADILDTAKNQMRMTKSENRQMLDQMAADGVDLTEIEGSFSGSYWADVDHVELGLTRIRIKDNATDFYLTPTYTFYGTMTQCDENGEPMVMQWFNSDGEIIDESPVVTVKELVCINAVDGSVINTQLGY